ncbi:imidazole glycerol phosphate synthase subunit HisH [Canibacter zhoujuaniae]|uniref:imidazole glycerol phosphate synthase subunit HisH n=1 Tax=Canibacter zhoujuaniae TaxID=2708343 RepID=UPI001423242D|nr:imidazole glycerol phosphate synthase subunit HisH [Canibacter zhoujuaniae]
MNSPVVAVLAYGSGNVHSAVKALQAAGAEVRLTADPKFIATADGLFVPGVGAFDAVMQQLTAVNGVAAINERLADGKPVMGICVGQQILFESGTERQVHSAGLGILSGSVAALPAKTLPHMGWNTVAVDPRSTLFAGLADEAFYFVHSNAVSSYENGGVRALSPALAGEEVLLTTAEHEGAKFIAAVECGPLSATQFHPEKSGSAGLKLLSNWINSLR